MRDKASPNRRDFMRMGLGAAAAVTLGGAASAPVLAQTPTSTGYGFGSGIVVAGLGIFAQHWPREMKALRISLLCEAFDVNPAGIRKSEQLRDLVECFASGVVARRA